jgi:hypothetical protein
VKLSFVAKHRRAWPVNLMCEALGVSRTHRRIIGEIDLQPASNLLWRPHLAYL